MVDYMRSELYKVTRRSYLYLSTGVLLLLETLLVLLWAWMNGQEGGAAFLTSAGAFSMIAGMLSVGYYWSVLTADMVFSEQYKFNTLKNEVSFGLSRRRIYVGKLAVEAVVSILVCLAVFLWYGLLCRLLLPEGEPWGKALEVVGFSFLAALPLWLGCLSLIHMLFFLMKSTTGASMIVAGMLVGAGQILLLLSMLVGLRWEWAGDVILSLRNLLLTTPLENISDHVGDWAVMGRAWVVGLGWLAATTAVGLTVFRKKEIS